MDFFLKLEFLLWIFGFTEIRLTLDQTNLGCLPQVQDLSQALRQLLLADLRLLLILWTLFCSDLAYQVVAVFKSISLHRFAKHHVIVSLLSAVVAPDGLAWDVLLNPCLTLMTCSGLNLLSQNQVLVMRRLGADHQKIILSELALCLRPVLALVTRLTKVALTASDLHLELALNISEEFEARLPEAIVETKLARALPKLRFTIFLERLVVPSVSGAFLSLVLLLSVFPLVRNVKVRD